MTTGKFIPIENPPETTCLKCGGANLKWHPICNAFWCDDCNWWRETGSNEETREQIERRENRLMDMYNRKQK